MSERGGELGIDWDAYRWLTDRDKCPLMCHHTDTYITVTLSHCYILPSLSNNIRCPLLSPGLLMMMDWNEALLGISWTVHDLQRPYMWCRTINYFFIEFAWCPSHIIVEHNFRIKCINIRILMINTRQSQCDIGTQTQSSWDAEYSMHCLVQFWLYVLLGVQHSESKISPLAQDMK